MTSPTKQLALMLLGGLVALAASGCYVDAYPVLVKDGVADDGGDDDSGTGEGSDDDGHDESGWEPETGSPLLDMPEGDPLPSGDCRPDARSLDAPLPCGLAPPTSTLEPTVAWQWFGHDDETSVLVTPLVANLTDDDLSGSVDLCDRPDVVAIAVDLPDSPNMELPSGHIYLLDGTSGEVHVRFDRPVDATITPVIADLDGDDVPEIIATERRSDDSDSHRVIAFRASGEVLWVSNYWSTTTGGLAVVDLDQDGSPELIAPDHVLRATGELAWAPADLPSSPSLPVPADLDLDGDLELIFGRSIYDHEGVLVETLDVPGPHNVAVAAVANFDADPEPEIFIQSQQLRLFDHDGANLMTCGGGAKAGPSVIADIDGDGQLEVITQRNNKLRAIRIGESCSPLVELDLDFDQTASATSFNLDAYGAPETITVANDRVSIRDSAWIELAGLPHQVNPASLATPVVVDADNDGAAEILLAGSAPSPDPQRHGQEVATLQLVQNADDRFAPTRRIWNQHAYYVTNINEDGHVPAVQEAHWLSDTNSFRTNRERSYDEDQCQPPEPVLP